jgi:hypothetical protein
LTTPCSSVAPSSTFPNTKVELQSQHSNNSSIPLSILSFLINSLQAS